MYIENYFCVKLTEGNIIFENLHVNLPLFTVESQWYCDVLGIIQHDYNCLWWTPFWSLWHSNWPIDAPVCHTYFVSLTQMVQPSWLTYMYKFEPNYPELQHHNLAGRFYATYCTATYL